MQASLCLRQRNLLQLKQFESLLFHKNKNNFSKMNDSLHSVENKGNIVRINNIQKSPQDTREYRGLKLENGIKALLISDPTTDISAASLSVEVGHMNDPPELPGIAHFCEHMLFLGTKKYPDENAYSSFLSQNGGSSNAATYPNMTKYYFDVNPTMLEGALDRFAQFFINPLFTESATDREINAVNSEHEKNLAADAWRIRQVNKNLCLENHPYSKFGSGNYQTLKVIPEETGIDVREELIEFHKKWYSSNIMSLAVFGKESLQELENMVLTKFELVANKDITLSSWPPQPYAENQYATKVSIMPIKDIRALTLSFTSIDLDPFYKSGPEHYLSHLIGHEGKGSILSELRKKGWCNDLSAGHHNISRGFGFFEVTVDLTTDGFENIDEIVLLIFQYLKLLRTEGPKKDIFDEYCNLNEMLFRFKEKESPLSLVSNVVHSMQVYPLKDVLSAPYLITEWKPEAITNLLNDLVPRKCRLIIVGKHEETDMKEIEPWYKTKYNVVKITDNVLKKWENCDLNKNFHLPEPNPFIPTNFNIIAADTNITKHPVIIRDSPYIRVWHKQDVEFCKPKSFINFDFSNPIVYFDPLNCNLTHMLVSCFKDDLNEYIYDAELAGLKFNLNNTTSGISVNLCGYSHKLNILLQKVLNQLFNFRVDPKRFEILKEDYIRSLKNFKAEQPYQHAVYYLALILTENAWSKGELLDAIQLVTYDRLQQFAKDFFARLHTECFVYGNVNKTEALEIIDLCITHLEATNSTILPILAKQLLQKREYKLYDGESYIFKTENEFHQSSCAELYMQCNSQTDSSIAIVDLVSQLLTEPCYNALRTEEQLGYIVFCGSRKANGATGIRIIVQSSKSPIYVEQRIENFLCKMLNNIETMTEDEFERHKNGLATQKLEKPKKMSTLFFKYLNEISLAQFHFDRAESEVAILKKITKEELISFYKVYILKDSPARRVLSVHITSTLNSPQNDENLTEEYSSDKCKVISDLSSFKSSKELFPVVRPYLNVHPKGAKSKL